MITYRSVKSIWHKTPGGVHRGVQGAAIISSMLRRIRCYTPPDQNHSTRCARPPAGRNSQMRRGTLDRASVLPAKRAAASECDTTPLQNRHDSRISTLLVEKTGSNSGKSTIIGGCNARSGDSQPMPSRKENQSNLVTWGNKKTVPVSSPSVIPNGPNRTRRPPNIVDLPEFKVDFATTTRQTSQIRTVPSDGTRNRRCSNQSSSQQSSALRTFGNGISTLRRYRPCIERHSYT